MQCFYVLYYLQQTKYTVVITKIRLQPLAQRLAQPLAQFAIPPSPYGFLKNASSKGRVKPCFL